MHPTVTGGSWRNWYPLVSSPLYRTVSLCCIMVWRMLCAVGSTQSAWRSCTAIIRTRGVELGHTPPWAYDIRKLPSGMIYAYFFFLVYSNSLKTCMHLWTKRGINPRLHRSVNNRVWLNKDPTRSNSMQSGLFYYRVTTDVSDVTAPIIRSTKNCNRNLRYRS